jgi:hypothetical protein
LNAPKQATPGKAGGIQTMKLHERIQGEIRRRAFARADWLAAQSDREESTRHTLDALASVTGLAHSELEAIAAQVGAFYENEADRFFSIRQQLIGIGAALMALMALMFGTGLLLL